MPTLIANEVTGGRDDLLFRRVRDLLSAPPRRTLWLHQSQNLYLVDRQADAYIDLMGFSGYVSAFHDDIHTLIGEHRAEILGPGPCAFEVFDLGPGYPDKTFSLLEEVRRRGVQCRYTPVDVSARFLDIASSACQPYGVTIAPVHCLFEELPAMLNGGACTPPGWRRLVIIGVTFMNYLPSVILRLLANLIRDDDAILIAAELFDKDRLDGLLAPYQTSKAEDFNFLVLDLLGVPRHAVRYFVRFRRKRIEMGFHVLDQVRTEHDFIFEAGQEIVTSMSYRHTLEELRTLLESKFRSVRIFVDSRRGSAIAKLSQPGCE